MNNVHLDIMANSHISLFGIVLIILIVHEAKCIEKTLRKIVRNQAKMVQRPFSHQEVEDVLTYNKGSPAISNTLLRNLQKFPGYTQMKTVYYTKNGPKVSTIISSIDTGKSKTTYTKYKVYRQEQFESNDQRSVRNIYTNTSFIMTSTEPYSTNTINEKSDFDIINTKNNYNQSNIYTYTNPKRIKFDHDINERSIVNNSTLNLFIRNQPNNKENFHFKIDTNTEVLTSDVIEGHNNNSSYLTTSRNPYLCVTSSEQIADIDAQIMFTEFNIQPSWASRKQFWNSVFDSRYEALMRNSNWPPLKVILIPRTQVDSIWRKSFDSYHNVVSKILTNVVKKLQFYSNLTFSWNEVSHLSMWWKTTTQKSRMGFRRLLKENRIEITTGGWVEPDEGTISIFGLVHQLVEGHQWLKTNLNYVPKVAWLTNSVSHSPTMSYLLSASGITYTILTNLHFAWEEWLAEYQYSDFIWLQNWQNYKRGSNLDELLNRIGKKRLPRHATLNHFLQFNSAGFKSCGPYSKLCLVYNFANKSGISNDVHGFNIKEKAEMLLEQYSKSGTLTPHNVIIAPIGGPFRYEFQTEFDYQYNNYQKLIEFINANQHIYKANLEFGIPKTYFDYALQRHKTYPTIQGDFLNFADISNGSPAYWSGYFTSRPLYKILLRRMQATLRTAEILFSLAFNLNAFYEVNMTHLFPLLTDARKSLSRLMDRHSVGGTLTKNALQQANIEISKTVKNCWYIQEYSASHISSKSKYSVNAPFLHKYVYRDGEFVSFFRTVIPNDRLYILNTLAHERIEIVVLISRYANLRILDYLNREVKIQLNPVWKYNAHNNLRISTTYYKVVFMVTIPAMTIALFKIRESYDATLNAAVLYCLECSSEDAENTNFFPFKTQPLDAGDIQIESYKLRLTFDENTGFLKTVLDKDTNLLKNVVINYNAFKSSDKNSGTILFNTDANRPLFDILKQFRIGIMRKNILIVVGDITTELNIVYGRLLQHTITVYNVMNNPFSKAIHVETQIDYEYSPKYRDLEMFLSIQTDIVNGDLPKIVTDNNGFQYTLRKLNISRPLESNVYPFTSIAYIQDNKERLSVITDHAQGVTALQEGQIVIILDRRVLYNDGRGNNEGLSDSSKTHHRHFILFESFDELINEPEFTKENHESLSTLPSFSAWYLSNIASYDLELFIMNRNITRADYHTILPLMKTPLPCGVLLLNFRMIYEKGSTEKQSANTAFMILHRQRFSCEIDKFPHPFCKCDDNNFSWYSLLYRVRIVYKTLLTGTNKGIISRHLDFNTFPDMEIATFRIYF